MASELFVMLMVYYGASFGVYHYGFNDTHGQPILAITVALFVLDLLKRTKENSRHRELRRDLHDLNQLEKARNYSVLNEINRLERLLDSGS